MERCSGCGAELPAAAAAFIEAGASRRQRPVLAGAAEGTYAALRPAQPLEEPLRFLLGAHVPLQIRQRTDAYGIEPPGHATKANPGGLYKILICREPVRKDPDETPNPLIGNSLSGWHLRLVHRCD